MSIFKDLVTVDFETEAIGSRPDQYPPKPVGVAITWADGRSEYLAWGHLNLDGTLRDDNNCSFDVGRRAVALAFKSPCLFHNGPFDIEVAVEHMGLTWPAMWHDTLFMLFLHDPHALSFSLKPSAQRLLQEPPDEQDAVRDWILANVPGATKKEFGAYICYAPVALVEPYALGDVGRTRRIFELLAPRVLSDMPDSYMRELRLAPHLVAAEKRGIRVDRSLLLLWAAALDDTPGSGGAIDRCDTLIRARLNDPTLNVDADDDLVLALDREGAMNGWVLTDGTRERTEPTDTEPVDNSVDNPFGVDEGSSAGIVDRGAPQETIPNPEPKRKAKRSVSKKALAATCKDAELVATLDYRNTAATMLRTFIRPWLQLSERDGRLHTKWHSVRGQDKNGTRTGRIASADPNLANVPNPKNMKPPAPGLPFLPSLRMALLPEPGHLWVSVDYSQQELRITAHYEDGEMMKAYNADPKLDLHDYAQKLIHQLIGVLLERKKIKNTAFATIYGAGLAQLAAQMSTTPEEAFGVRAAYFKALPGLEVLANNVKVKSRMQGYVRSAGGRLIPLERSRIIKGRMRTFDYKMLNHLIQGTAAEQTKQAIVDFCEAGYSGTFLGQVYDEINISVPPDALLTVTRVLLDCMVNAVPLDVPMVCDVEVGSDWGSIKAFDIIKGDYVEETATA